MDVLHKVCFASKNKTLLHCRIITRSDAHKWIERSGAPELGLPKRLRPMAALRFVAAKLNSCCRRPSSAKSTYQPSLEAFERGLHKLFGD